MRRSIAKLARRPANAALRIAAACPSERAEKPGTRNSAAASEATKEQTWTLKSSGTADTPAARWRRC